MREQQQLSLDCADLQYGLSFGCSLMRYKASFSMYFWNAFVGMSALLPHFSYMYLEIENCLYDIR